MSTITIYRPPTTVVITIDIDEKTVYQKKLMGQHQIVAEFFSSVVIPVLIGDYITWESNNYYINRLPDVTKKNNQSFYYKITFESELSLLHRKLFISNDGLADYSYNGKPVDFITNIVSSLNSIGSGWSVGTVEDVDPLSIDFNSESCYSALMRVAKLFSMEFSIVSKAITMQTTVGTTQSHVFEYGRGKGLYKIERQQVSNANIVTKAYGFGGTKNIGVDYRSRSKRLVFEERFLLKNNDVYGIIEGQFTDENIFPQRTAAITSANLVFDYGDSGTDYNPRTSYLGDLALNFDINDYLIEGEVAKVVFKTGDLAGVECEIWKYDNATKRIYINPYIDADGYVQPRTTAVYAVSDTYTLVGIRMPQTYIDAAETALETATQTWLDQNSIPKVVYSMEFDQKYAKTVALDLEVGDKVTIIDSDLGVNALIRISGIEYPIVNKFKLKATIADFVPYTVQERLISASIDTVKETAYVERRSAELSRRNAVKQQQLKSLLFDTDGYFEPTNIKPLSIETTYLSVGAKSTNFVLSGVSIKPNYLADQNRIYVSAGSLIHFLIDIAGNYTWVIGAPLDTASLTAGTAYYLYAKCSTSANTGVWELSATKKMFESEPGYYLFLCGILFAAVDGRRDYDFTYGMTYINGRTITTGRIQSSDGLKYFDIDSGVFRGEFTIVAGSGYGNLTDKPTSLAGINSGEGSKLGGIAAGAQVNTINSGDGLNALDSAANSKLAGIAPGATVGATWGANLYSTPARYGDSDSPASAGLFFSATHLGYYNGSNWLSYFDNAGNCKFVGVAEFGTSAIDLGEGAWNIALKGADIWENSYNDDSAGIQINRIGYNQGVTKYRSFRIYNGKGSLMGTFVGYQDTFYLYSDFINSGDAMFSGKIRTGTSYNTVFSHQVAMNREVPDPYACLDLKYGQRASGDHGALILPHLSTDDRDALIAEYGMLIYNITTSALNYYKGGIGWVAL